MILFKSMPIQPGDLFALSTAAAVSAGYTYTLSAYCLYGIALAAWPRSSASPRRVAPRRARQRSRAAW